MDINNQPKVGNTPSQGLHKLGEGPLGSDHILKDLVVSGPKEPQGSEGVNSRKPHMAEGLGGNISHLLDAINKYVKSGNMADLAEVALDAGQSTYFSMIKNNPEKLNRFTEMVNQLVRASQRPPDVSFLPDGKPEVKLDNAQRQAYQIWNMANEVNNFQGDEVAFDKYLKALETGK